MAMRSRSRILLPVLALTALIGGCDGDRSAGPADPPAAADPEPAAIVEPGDLGPCGKLPIPDGFRCGSIEVPVFRSGPDAGTTEIGFAVRSRRRAGEPAAGAIFAVEGGPGYSSTGSANVFGKLFAPLLADHDLVLVDQRGTGRSGPVGCPDLQRARAPATIALPECARRLGPAWESYTTANAAADVDAVRAALGFDRITLYGDSYGTYLAQSYAYRFPDRLRALILDSAYPVRGEGAWYPSLPQTGIKAMDIVCERSAECSGDALRRLDRLAELLRETGRGVGPLIDAIGAAGAYGAPGSYRRIDRAGRRLLAGRPREYLELIRVEKPAFKRPRQFARSAELIVSCNDYPMIWDRRATEAERRIQLEDSIRAYDRSAFEPFTPREIALSSDLGYLECLTWPPPTERREPPIRLGMEPTAAPVLVLAGELDDVTTPYEGRLVAEQFPNSEFELIRNVGHVDALYHLDGEAAAQIRRFLRRVLSN